MIEKSNTMYTSLDYDVPAYNTNRATSKQKLYARALYDNIADTPDELAFKKGDVLNVIEQDTDGLGGWWLCSLRGRQGICPGNRLRILHSYDSGCFSPSPASSPCPSLAASTATLNSSILSSDIYENSSIISSNNQQMQHHNIIQTQQILQSQQQNHNSSQGKRRSWHITPHKVITPQRCGDVYLYDWASPSNRSSPYQNCSIISDSDTYDTPKSVTSVNYDCPKNWSKTPKKHDNMSTPPKTTADAIPAHLLEESYDIPKPISLLHQQNMTPSSSNSSLLTSDSYSMSFSSSNRSSLANMPDYDIPRRNPIPIRNTNHHTSQIGHQHYPLHQQQSSTYDYPQPSAMVQNQISAQQQQKPLPRVTKELPLELSSALEMLAKLQNEATTAISRLLAFVTPDWRNRDKLEPVIMDIKLAAVRLRTALHDLTEFSDGALGNASRADDRTLALKLRPLVKALKDADNLIHTTTQMLDIHSWSMDQLSRNEQKITPPPDSLDQLMACAQTLIEDVRQSTSFIQGNASLLFKRLPETQATNNTNNTNNNNNNNNNNNANNNNNGGDNEWLEDYDYVKFESKETTAKKNSELREAIPQNLKKKFDNVIKTAESTAIAEQTELNPNDKLVVKYYAAQITNHMGYLTQAIDSFLETVEKNQPPKYFIAYGKFVVFSAHNLVGIGDSVHRNVSKQELKDKIERYTDALSDALKTCVTNSKKAAQHFPSVTAVQEMVDSVVDISHLASDLKIAMLQVVQQVI